MSLKNKELDILVRYANNAKFIIETGRGRSTRALAEIVQNTGSALVSIDIEPPQSDMPIADNITYLTGWSIRRGDFIKPEDARFKKSRYENMPDEAVVYGGSMDGEVDLIRRTLENTDRPLDLFFCDTGEYSGYPEWRIIQNRMAVGGKFIAHDIYYPKSIKSFQSVQEIRDAPDWKMLEIYDASVMDIFHYSNKRRRGKSSGIVVAEKVR